MNLPLSRRANAWLSFVCFFFFSFLDYILRIVRQYRVLPDEPAGGHDAIQPVRGDLSVDLVRRAIGGPRGRCGDERAERRVPGACDVSTVPALLRILRQLRRDSDLPAVDHVSQLHQIRLRGNRFNHLRLRS